jgi:hypothetical protein
MEVESGSRRDDAGACDKMTWLLGNRCPRRPTSAFSLASSYLT